MKNEDKKIYLVVGSHDGPLGVYSNVKYAYQRAMQYFKDGDNETDTTYSKCLEECKNWGCTMVNESHETSVTIEVHYLNN